MNRNHSARTGFTLIELLIAISLFATIVVSLYSALSVGIVAWKRGDQGSNIHQTGRIILDTMTDEIRKCVYFDYIQFVGKANEIYFPIAIKVTEPSREAKATFSTNIFKITYLLDKKSYRDRYKTLMRKQETFLQSLIHGKVKPKEFAPGIAKLEFQYAYRKPEEELILSDQSDQLVWLDEWKVKDRIPMAVKVRLVIAIDPSKRDSKKAIFNRTIVIPQGTIELEPTEEDKK